MKKWFHQEMILQAHMTAIMVVAQRYHQITEWQEWKEDLSLEEGFKC